MICGKNHGYSIEFHIAAVLFLEPYKRHGVSMLISSRFSTALLMRAKLLDPGELKKWLSG